MLTITDRVMLVDLSNFSLGATITVYEGDKIMLRHTVLDISEVEEKTIEIANEMEIENVFIKPLATANITKTLEKFDRVVFESIVDKIIIGDIDGVGNVDPYKLTFVLKGVESKVIQNAKVRYKKW